LSKQHYYLLIGQAIGYAHPHPERTAIRNGPGVFDPDEYRVWPSRAAMLQACKMSEHGSIIGQRSYRPLVKEVDRAANR
jgi:hypothetical protein